MQQIGLLTVNDIRKTFNRVATEGGENVFITTNTQPLAAPKVDPLLEEPQPEQQPAQSEESEINKIEKEPVPTNE